MNFQNVKRNLLFFFSLIIILSACTKILTTEIGNNLLPPNDNVVTKDTFITVYAKNAGDSLIKLALSDDHVVGSVNDPLFGSIKASINVQMVPAFFPYSFQVTNGDSITNIDSVVLVLHFDGVWGDSSQSLNLHVFEIAGDQQMSSDSVYNTSYSVNTAEELTKGPITINPKGLYADSFHVFGNDSGVSAIRIPLNTSICSKFLNGQFPFDANDAYLNDSLFNIYFRGLQITADASSPTGVSNDLFKISLTNTDSRLAIYYKYKNPDSIGVIDTAVRYFSAESGSSAHSNTIVRNRSGAQISNNYPIGNTTPSKTNQDSLIYISANPGSYANISIPDLSGLRNIVVHRAELLMYQARDPEDGYYYDTYLSPPQLMVAGYSADSSRRIAMYSDLLDVSGVINLSEFGTSPVNHYDITTNLLYYSYNLDVSRYVQGIVTRQDSNYTNVVLYAPFYNEYIYSEETATIPFELSSTVINSPACGRIRLGGGNSVNNKMVLHIIYSTF
jgi:hypothetical protein